MATIDDLNLAVRVFMRNYPFKRFRIDPVPCAPLRRPLAEARVALVTTAGFYGPGQTPFDQITAGDHSFREIAAGVDLRELRESHNSSSFDHTGIRQDANLALPLDRLRELVERGVIGSVNDRQFSFMGSIINPRRLIRETAPEVATLLREDGVDCVLLTPV